MDGTPSTVPERVQGLLQPVSAGARGGSDPRLGARFDEIQVEIGKLASASGSEVDWPRVVERSEDLLAQEGKDIRIAVYLGLGWYRLEGIRGLQRGFELLTGLLDGFWEDAFPPLAKVAARAEVVSWLSDRLKSDLAQTLARATTEQVTDVWNAFARLRTATRLRFIERGPSLAPIEQCFEAVAPDVRAKLESAAPSTEAVALAPDDETGDPILRPITGDDAAGADPFLADEFEALRTEITKVGGIAAQEADWPKVVALAQKVLVERAKDLRCVAYLSLGRCRVEGAKGLRESIDAMAALAQRYGDSLHPRRSKGRAGALVWLGERMQAELARNPLVVTADELRELRAAVAAAKAVTDPLTDACSGLSILDEALSKIKPKSAGKSAPATPTTKAVGASPPPAAAPATASIDPSLQGIADSMLAELNARTARIGEDAVSLRLRRYALWLALPAAQQGKKHECDSGSVDQRNELAAFAKAEKWAELLQRCESAVVDMPFWLDLTYYSMRAAEHVLGKDAAQALKGELTALLQRAPALRSGFDRKGQWLASKDVRDWLWQELTFRPPPEEPSTPPPAAPTAPENAPAAASAAAPPPDADTLLSTDIVELVRQKKTGDALAQAEAWLAAAGNPRSRFIRTLTLAQTCLAVGDPRIAFPLFRALEGQLRTATLAQLEPQLAVACIRGYLQTKRDAGINLAPADERLVDELALLDPKALTGLFR